VQHSVRRLPASCVREIEAGARTGDVDGFLRVIAAGRSQILVSCLLIIHFTTTSAAVLDVPGQR